MSSVDLLNDMRQILGRFPKIGREQMAMNLTTYQMLLEKIPDFRHRDQLLGVAVSFDPLLANGLVEIGPVDEVLLRRRGRVWLCRYDSRRLGQGWRSVLGGAADHEPTLGPRASRGSQ